MYITIIYNNTSKIHIHISIKECEIDLYSYFFHFKIYHFYDLLSF